MASLEFTGLSGRAATAAVELTPPERRRLELAAALLFPSADDALRSLASVGDGQYLTLAGP